MSTIAALLANQNRQADKIMLPILWLLFAMALGLASWYDTWKMAVFIGGALALAPSLLMLWLPGSRLTRSVVAAAFMMFCALHIQQAMGVTELHFGIFVLLAVLLCYRDWLVIVIAAAIIALHHLTFNYFQELGYGPICFTEPGFGRVMVHATYVVSETVVLCIIAVWLARDARQAAELRALVGQLRHNDHPGVDLRLDASSPASEAASALHKALSAVAGSVGQVRGSAVLIHGAVSAIASGNRDVQSGAHLQAQAVEQAVATIQSISETVAHDSEQAVASGQKVDAVMHMATKGHEAMQESMATMQGISQASSKISEITAVIDSIAFQTNILALNAAVEAARAGPEGKGFAVVAGEVRSLAQRSADAAREIRGLIDASVARVADGSALIERAGTVMAELSLGITGVATTFQEITQANEAQGQRILEVGQAIGQINAIVHENMIRVDQTDANVHVLKAESDDLMQAVSLFLVNERAGYPG